MKILLLLAFFGFITSRVLADGIPVDHKTNQVTVPHTVLTLSESQVEEIETLHTLTLDTEQWKKLRQVGPHCPKRIADILPVTWNDCTCGIGFYGIQLSRNQVAVTNDQLTYDGGIDFSYEAGEAESDPASVWLTVDRRGQFYHKGILVPFAKLLQAIAATDGKIMVDQEQQQRWLSVEFPLGLDRKSEVLKARLDQLFQTAKKSGWSTPDDN